jgi:nitrogen regulatory protein P-II 1
MKKIEAIIRKSKFDEVRDALHDVNVYFFSYWDVTTAPPTSNVGS